MVFFHFERVAEDIHHRHENAQQYKRPPSAIERIRKALKRRDTSTAAATAVTVGGAGSGNGGGHPRSASAEDAARRNEEHLIGSRHRTKPPSALTSFLRRHKQSGRKQSVSEQSSPSASLRSVT